MTISILSRERDTVERMIRIYCHGHHSTSGSLCPECQTLMVYTNQRVDKCPFQANKPTCVRCHVHCYKPEMRERIRKVMRYASPRMLYKHPILVLFHLLHSLKKTKG